MREKEMLALAARQHRCLSLAQLEELGFPRDAIRHRVLRGTLIPLHEAVFAVAPILSHERDTRRMGAALTEAGSYLCRAEACEAFGFWPFRPPGALTIVRSGSGGPVTRDGVRVHRSTRLAGETTLLRGIPITGPERAAIDVAALLGERAIARMVREAIRLKHTDPNRMFAALYRHKGRRGTRRLGEAVARYAGLPLDRSRSDPEIVALEILRDAGVPEPVLNEEVAGEEADLHWPQWRLIIEIDGPQWHLDRAEDARKEAIWRAAGWVVLRIPSDDVYTRPDRLLAIARPPAAAQHRTSMEVVYSPHSATFAAPRVIERR